MRVLFTGRTICDFTTMQRLLLVAEEIAFMDRPSVTFDDWGLVGCDSEARGLKMPDDSPVALAVYRPPSGSANVCYQKYVEQDVANPTFVSTFMEGLGKDAAFASKFVTRDATYGSATGRQVVSALAADISLTKQDLHGPVDGRLLFQVDSAEGRRETLKSLLHDASVMLTSGIVVSAQTDLLPVSDDRFVCRLLTLRAASDRYVGTTPRVSGVLGLAVAQAVLPDEILKHLTFGDLLDYRKEAKNTYSNFTIEINRLATRILDADPSRLDEEMKTIVNQEIAPGLREYRNEMRTIRDRMFGELVKKVAKWEVPTLSLAHLVGLSWGHALTAFLSALVPAAAPDLVEYVLHKRDATRKNALTYLIGVAPEQ